MRYDVAARYVATNLSDVSDAWLINGARCRTGLAMFSPSYRVYNSPDVDKTNVEVFLQRLRIQRALNNFGHFTCNKKTTKYGIEPPLARKLEPIRRTVNVPCQLPHNVPMIRKQTIHAPVFPEGNIVTGHIDMKVPVGHASGSVSLIKNNNNVNVHPMKGATNPSFFKPFRPQRPALKLPTLVARKLGARQSEGKLTNEQPKAWVKEQQRKILPDILVNRECGREKQLSRWQRERDFKTWEKGELKFASTASQRHVRNITSNRNRDYVEHIRENATGQESLHRRNIRQQIKRGVRERLAANNCPVLEMTFDLASK